MRPPPATGARVWQQPVEILKEHGRSPVVLICEHASNHIPAEYDGLGRDAETLHDHIAWDIGAAAVTRALSRKLDAVAFLGTLDRKSVVEGKSVSVRVDLGGRSIIKKKTTNQRSTTVLNTNPQHISVPLLGVTYATRNLNSIRT